MFFKRTNAGSTHRCQRCARIRAFVAVAAMMIIAMPLLSDQAPALADLTPMHFALAIVGLGGLGFILRWIAWRRDLNSAASTR